MNFLENKAEEKGFFGCIQKEISRGRISMKHIKALNQDIAIELEKQFLDYTGSQSTSLSNERMEQVVRSWFYVLDLYMDTFLNEDFIDEILEKRVKTIYEDAYAYIQIYIQETKYLYRDIEAVRIPIDNHVYEDTFTRAVPDFFSNYNFKYDAESLVSDIDYPLIFDFMDTKGIRYIRSYLETFKVENEACLYFQPSQVYSVLKDYSLKSRVPLKDLPTNHFEPIIQTHFFKTFVSDLSDKLVLTQEEYDEISAMFYNMCADEIVETLQAMHKIYTSKTLYWDSPVRDYVNRFIREKCPFWAGAIETKRLKNLVAVEN
ncbi:DUF6179 domain-containing protein [Fusibacter sp. JL216-2]|uniref:DUF6179 domain-containing protein n=1 Tax=Fusibacter sp. JL216-2 TaxID=3071453 RepID=UPI003D341F20